MHVNESKTSSEEFKFKSFAKGRIWGILVTLIQPRAISLLLDVWEFRKKDIRENEKFFIAQISLSEIL